MQNYGNGAAFPASSAGNASVRIPHGVAPTAPVNGDVWTTAAGVFVRIGGVTIGPLAPANLAVKSGAFTAASNGMYNVQLTAAATVTLPSAPAAGDTVFLQDYNATWNSYVLTVGSATANIIPVGGGTAVTSITAAAAGNLNFTYNGSVWLTYYQPLAAAAGAASADVQVFNYTGSAQTWTKKAGAKNVYIWACQGGGGGGGGGTADINSQGNGANGGNGGWSTETTIPAAALPATVSVTVGAGGVGNSRGSTYAATNPTAGGHSTFGTFLSTLYALYQSGSVACGGSGGAGGYGSNGYSPAGSNGTQGSLKRGAPNSFGTGGAQVPNYQNGTQGGSATTDVGASETNCGSGGGGGSGSYNSGGAGAGGAGAVPGGGGGGGGGGSSAAGGYGGSGGAGRVVVITYF